MRQRSERSRSGGRGDLGGRRKPKNQMMALENELRRSAMRLLNASKDPISTNELAEELGVKPNSMGYQMSVLADYRLAERIPGKPDHGAVASYWSSMAKNDGRVNTRLRATADPDSVKLNKRKDEARDREPTHSPT